MTNFILGTLASIFAVFLVWVSKEYIFPEVRRRFFSDIPTVAGTYDLVKMSFEDPHKASKTEVVKRVQLNQSGSKVWGYIVNERAKSKSKLTGRITGSRLLNFSFEPENKNIHDYGTAMLRLSFNGKELAGIVTFICGCCEKVTPTFVTMKKKDVI